jgi:hypothetical protein
MRSHGAAVFAPSAFHFDNIGAKIGENHAGGGAGDDAAEVEYADTLKYGGQENEDNMRGGDVMRADDPITMAQVLKNYRLNPMRLKVA